MNYTATVTGTDASGNPVTHRQDLDVHDSASRRRSPASARARSSTTRPTPTVLRGHRPARRSPSASGSPPTPTARSPASGSTRAPTTPAPTPARCGPPTARRWRPARSPDESTSGWQTLTFAQPVSIAKDTEYVASYRTPVGRYSATPERLRADEPVAIAAPGRRRRRVPTPTAPASRRPSSATNYLVDVVFERPAPRSRSPARTPAPGAVDVPREQHGHGDGSPPRSSRAATMTVTARAPPRSPGTHDTRADGTRLTFTPTATLPADATIR